MLLLTNFDTIFQQIDLFQLIHNIYQYKKVPFMVPQHQQHILHIKYNFLSGKCIIII